MKEKAKQLLKINLIRTIKSILIALILEILIFNYPAIRTLCSSNKSVKANYILNEKSIFIENVGFKVTSIKINYKNQLTDKITYNLTYSTEENSDYVSINSKVLLPKDRQEINFDTRSKVKTISIELITDSNLEIKDIILNNINFNFNVYRFVLIVAVVIFILKIKDESIYKVNYDTKDKLHKNFFCINLLIFIFITIIYINNQYDFKSAFIRPEEIPKDDAILMQAESFINGKIELLAEPSEELKNMENPYDSVKRDKENIPFLYDIAYYNENYYNYFGVAPIILVVTPFRLITGMYLHTYIFNFIFIIGILFSLYVLYKKIIEKYIKDISLLNFYLGYYCIIFASNVFTLLRGAKYDIVVSSGIMFLLLSIYLAISIYDNIKYKNLKLIALGFCMANIVLSKPNFIVYYPLILACYLYNMKKQNRKESILDVCLVGIPLSILAVFQMWLNYSRFDSIFEFGARYQLTGFNMNACMQITFGKILLGIGEYLFRTPTINPFKFPFVFINKETMLNTINEVCYENRLIGLVSIPIMWFYIVSKQIMNKDNKNLEFLLKIAVLVSVISIILSTCFGGICEAYSIDFKMILSIGAVLIALIYINNSKDKKLSNKVFLIITLATILIMIPISFTTEKEFLTNLRNSQTVYLKNLFEFWN